MTVDGNNKVTFPAIKRDVTYTFTAPNTSKYVFNNTDGKIGEIVIIDGTTKIDVTTTELEKGKTYDVYMTTTDTSADSLTVKITEMSIYAGSNSIDFAAFPTNVAYKLTVKETGTYKFVSTSTKLKTLVIKLDGVAIDATSASGTTLSSGIEYELTANK